MTRPTTEQNDAIRRATWGEFRLPYNDALGRLRAKIPTSREVADLIAKLGDGGGTGDGGGEIPFEEPGALLRERLQVINSETFSVSMTGNTAGEFRGVACTSPLPCPAVITQLFLRVYNVQDAFTWMATLVPSDISDSGPGDINGIPLFNARFPNLGGTMGTYPVLAGTTLANIEAPTDIRTFRLVEQPGMRVALWVETGVITWRANLFVTVGTFDPSVTVADMIKARLPRQDAWQRGSEIFDARQKALEEARAQAEAENAARRAAAAAAAAKEARPVPSRREPAAPSVKTITIPQSPYPKAMTLRTLQGGRVLDERTVSWGALSPVMKNYWIKNQENGVADPTMQAIW